MRELGTKIPHFIFAWGHFLRSQPVSLPHVNHNLLEFASSYAHNPLNMTVKINVMTNLMRKATQMHLNLKHSVSAQRQCFS